MAFNSAVRFVDDDEVVPTTVFVPTTVLSRPWSSLNERDLVARMIAELPSFVPSVEATRPLECVPAVNVFLQRTTLYAPNLPWATNVPARTVRRASRLPFVVLAMAVAIGVGLWHDPSARREVLSSLSDAHSQMRALFLRE